LGVSETMLPIPDLSDVDVAFPAHALDWMPAWDEIPDEFKNMNRETEWNEIVSQWFFSGLPEKVKFIPRDGVDPEKAFRAVQATLGSFAPKHQHKEAAAAYMLSCWFKKVKGWKS
jgi:hypothetical protein